VRRPSWTDTWLCMAGVMAFRATCPRLQTAALIVSPDNRLLSTGYNGAPAGADHCMDEGCLLDGEHCVRSVHAELNAIIYAAKRGIAIDGATMYVLHKPCVRCAAVIAAAGIAEVVYCEDYMNTGGDSLEQLETYGVRVRQAISGGR
jgi:dCMP deaminase